MPNWKVTTRPVLSVEVDAPTETAAREIAMAEPLSAWKIEGHDLGAAKAVKLHES